MQRHVVVVGSGVAGLTAALAASLAGAYVTILERADVLGGTTTYSGGWVWVPNNHLAQAAGIVDSESEILKYLHSLDLGDWDWDRVAAYIRKAPEAVQWIEQCTPLRWTLLDFPDYHAEMPGGTLRGRVLAPRSFEAGPDITRRLREDPTGRDYASDLEHAAGLTADQIEFRRRNGVLGRGRAIAAALLVALERPGVDIRTDARARRLCLEDGAVVGVATDDVEYLGAVVLASGGFERDADLVRTFLRGPLLAPGGAPTNVGDGLRMAMSVGAALGNMSEAWWCPAMTIPGEQAGGAQYFRMLFLEYTRPGCLMVDQTGKRFADEAQNYNDMGRALLEFSPTFQLPRVPAWLIFDSAFRRRYGLGQALPSTGEDPDYVARANDWSALAGLIGVPAEHLTDTIERFNAQAERGTDEDFGRGASAWGRHMGDAKAPHPNLAPLRVPPFYAVQIVPGALATKGGPRIDTHARVLRSDGNGPITGLYAAGNVAASPFGLAYPGGGSTIGPAIVFGWLGGTAAATATP